MIKQTGYVIEDDKKTEEREIRASLVADNKEEVIANGASCRGILGLMYNDKLTLGSTCLCATGDFGILDSEGNWHF